MSEFTPCRLVLSTGEVFHGRNIGASKISSGQLVFTTAMVGYSEALTDPSYYGQFLVFTYPLIGNYGIPARPPEREAPLGYESERIHAAGVIVNISSSHVFHWNGLKDLDGWLTEEGVPGIAGIDTRHLVSLLRERGHLLARVEPGDFKGRSEFYDPTEVDVLSRVSRQSREIVGKGKKRIALVDCGVKKNIVRNLVNLGCEVELLPWTTKLSEIDCDGWVLSNGPGDPKRSGNLLGEIRGLLRDTRPILGICLGHQLLALAAGAETRKMSYGHRSHNQPVIQCGTRRGFMTSQNHGFEVVRESLPDGWETWFLNANDGSVEGIHHRELPFRAVQFHPEAAAGPKDTAWIFRDFVSEVGG